MLRTVTLIFVFISCSFGQMMDPYMLYGGGLGMYGGMNPYLYNGGLANYGAYNPANLLLNPYNMDIQSTMLANYNAMNSMNGLNNVAGYGALNQVYGANALAGYGNSNIVDSGSTMSDGGIRGLRNRLPVMSRDGAFTRLPGHSLFDCTGVLSSRPCGPKRNVGAGTNWENTHDQS